MRPKMLIVHVEVVVREADIGAFKAATLKNVAASRMEPGIAAFELLEDETDPTRFLLVEAYRTGEAPAAHKATAHYAEWRDAVAAMMAEPRRSQKFRNVEPASQRVD